MSRNETVRILRKKKTSQSRNLSEAVRNKKRRIGGEKKKNTIALLTSAEVGSYLTLQIEAANPKTGKKQWCRLILDCGSERTYITEKFAKKLDLETKNTRELSVKGFGYNQPTTNYTATASFFVRVPNREPLVLIRSG